MLDIELIKFIQLLTGKPDAKEIRGALRINRKIKAKEDAKCLNPY